MKSIYVILNPVAGRGFSAKSEPAIRECLQNSSLPFEIFHTHHIGHGITLAEHAVNHGYDIVVAAGGDGTTNEVINGIMNAAEQGKSAVFGVFPTGTGSDFAFNVGMPADPLEACQRIIDGSVKKIDLGRISSPGKPPRYFDNQLGIGFDGIVTVEAKKFKRLRGMALYLPVVLKTVFLTHGPIPVSISCDDETIELEAVQITIANGAREGGGFYMTPDAKVDDGLFDVLIVSKVSKLGMLKLIPHFTKGTHLQLESTSLRRAKKVVVRSKQKLIAHFDGELLTDDNEITCELLPKCLDIIC
ncbi:diacylglycerol kinase family lipid kinase [candidate division KSB1 bacterium]|nr:diacylglycerol kinase family lipid kinase [candidate division KSB1 bacterium]